MWMMTNTLTILPKVQHKLSFALQEDNYLVMIQDNSHYLLKRQTKIAADDILIFYFYLSKKIRLDVSSESSA